MICPRKKIEINEEDCSGCIFVRIKRDIDDFLYLICDYNSWYPGLEKGRKWNEFNA